MSLAKPGDTVKVHYTGKLEDGTVFDSSAQREPIEFTIGGQKLIPGFEQAVVGMTAGEQRSVTIHADEAYGPHRKEMVLNVDREKLPADARPAVGQELQLHQSDGQTITARITEVLESAVTIDANHPLAGKDLTFDLQLLEVD